MGLSRQQMAALLTQAESRLRVMYQRIDPKAWKSVYDEVGKAIKSLDLAGSYIRENTPVLPSTKKTETPPAPPPGKPAAH